MRPGFPEYVDSTMRAAFVSCPRKFYNEYILNRRSGGANVHLIAGKAFAAGLEQARNCFWNRQMDSASALIEGQRTIMMNYPEPSRFDETNKSLSKTLMALEAYFENWGWDRDHFQPWLRPNGQHAIEFSFSIPLEGVVHPITGAPIIYCGRADWIGQHQDTGALYAVDEKTTSQLGATWPQQWKHRAQLTGYVWAGRQYGIPLEGALVRGISFLKNGFGHAESLQLRSEYYIERWLEQLERDIVRMIQYWHVGYFDYNFSDSCTSYNSPCPFTDSCTSSDPEKYVKSNFEHLRWNPIEHQVEELNDSNEVVRVVE